MPMDQAGLEALVANNPDALALVKDLGCKAAQLTPEVIADLPKLGEYKTGHAAMAKILETTKAKDAATLLTDFTNLKTVNADLVAQKDKWKADGKGKESPEYLALLEQIDANKKETEKILSKLTAAEEKEVKTTAEKRESDLKAAVIAAAGKGKANDPEDIHILLKARGLTGIKDDGTPFFHKLNAEGKAVDAGSAEAAVTAFLEKRKDLVGSSGTGGTGGGHKGAADDKPTMPANRAQARAEFKAARTGA